MAAAGPGGGGNLGTQSQGAGLDDDDLDIPGAGDFIDDAAPQDGDQLLALGPEGLAPDEEAEARAALAVVAAAPRFPGLRRACSPAASKKPGCSRPISCGRKGTAGRSSCARPSSKVFRRSTRTPARCRAALRASCGTGWQATTASQCSRPQHPRRGRPSTGGVRTAGETRLGV